MAPCRPAPPHVAVRPPRSATPSRGEGCAPSRAASFPHWGFCRGRQHRPRTLARTPGPLRSSRPGGLAVGLLSRPSIALLTSERSPSCAQVYTLVLAAGMGGLLLGYNSSNIAVALPVRGVACVTWCRWQWLLVPVGILTLWPCVAAGARLRAGGRVQRDKGGHRVRHHAGQRGGRLHGRLCFRLLWQASPDSRVLHILTHTRTHTHTHTHTPGVPLS